MNCEECKRNCKEEGIDPPCDECFQDVLEDIEEW